MEELRERTGHRGSEQAWLSVAYDLLVSSGVDAVKVMPMAKALGLSRTGFYWHFKDRKALLAALLTLWEKKNTGNLIARTRQYADTITEAMFNLFDCWVDEDLFDARLDFAVRNWSRKDHEVESAIRSADAQRILAISEMFQRFGYRAENATVRANTVYLAQVGYISMNVRDPWEERLLWMPSYVEMYTSTAPTEREIARFMARHAHLLPQDSSGAD